MDEARIAFSLDARSIRALHSAVDFTLKKWAGQEDIDQEMLFHLRTYLQACIFEFDFDKNL